MGNSFCAVWAWERSPVHGFCGDFGSHGACCQEYCLPGDFIDLWDTGEEYLENDAWILGNENQISPSDRGRQSILSTPGGSSWNWLEFLLEGEFPSVLRSNGLLTGRETLEVAWAVTLRCSLTHLQRKTWLGFLSEGQTQWDPLLGNKVDTQMQYIEGAGWVWEPDRHGFKSYLYCSPAVWIWATTILFSSQSHS